MSRISRPAFDGSPLDDFAVVDVYKETTAEVRNNFTSQYTAFASDLSSSLSRQREGLGSFFADARSGKMGLKTGLTRVTDLLKGSRAELNKLTSDFRGRLDAIMDSVPPEAYKMVKANIEDVYTTIRSADLDSVGGITSMLTDLTGKDLFQALDIGAEIALVAAALEEIDKWEVPEFVDEVLAFLGKDKQATFEAVRQSSGSLASSADIDIIEAVLRHTDPAALTRDVPDFAEHLLNRYRLKQSDTPDKYEYRRTQLINVLNKLRPGWLYTRRGGAEVYNLRIFQRASDDAKLLLSLSDEHRIPVLIASSYASTDVTSIMRGMYPLIPLNEVRA